MANLSLDDLALTTAGFAQIKLGMPLYMWQAEALFPLELATGKDGRRQNIAVVTPNGSGKDERIIPTAAYWWLYYHPQGRVVITSKSDMQLSEQTIPNLNKHWPKFGWEEPVGSPRYRLVTPTGGSLVAYVTNEGARTEGFHSRPGEPLLMIVNEAKSIDNSIWKGIDRCTPDVLLLVSSPGARDGRFYECFTKLQPFYTLIKAGLKDCPHIPKERIEHTIAKYGENDPYTRSTLYGEFMNSVDGQKYILTFEDLEAALLFPPNHKPGFKFGFFDFADGRAENVFVIRNGNKYEIVDAWRETNQDAVVGRAIFLIKKNGLKPEQVKADAAAKEILDKMAQAGCAIGRQNFGARDADSPYTSWSAMSWLEGAAKIRERSVIIPDDPVLRSQLTQRRQLFRLDGKLGVEDKVRMLKERGVESPDRADALFGAMAEADTSMTVKSVSFSFDDGFFGAATKDSTIGNCVGL